MAIRISTLILLPFVMSLAQGDDEATIRRLIADLGADEVDRRAAAQAELGRLGDGDAAGLVEHALEDAAQSVDPETATRARAVLQHLNAWRRSVLVTGHAADGCAGAIDIKGGVWLWQAPRTAAAWISSRSPSGSALLLSWSLPARTSTLDCRDLRTGDVRWTATGLPLSGADADSQRYWFSAGPDSLWRVSLDTGEIEHVELAGRRQSQFPWLIAATEDAAYVALDTGLSCIDADPLRSRWLRPDLHVDRVESVAGVPYVEMPGEVGTTRLARLDPKTGDSTWTMDFVARRGLVEKLDAGKVLIVGPDDNGLTYALDSESREVHWSASARPCWYDSKSNRLWLVSGGIGRVVNVATGDVVARGSGGLGEIYLADEERLFAATFDGPLCNGTVTAYDRESASSLWSTSFSGQAGHWSGMIPLHRKARSFVSMETLEGQLVVVGEGLGAVYIHVIDPATGAVLLRHEVRR